MPEIVPLRVQVIAQTQFSAPADVPWDTDADGGQALAEFAGRACYQAWDKPNPATATNEGYLRHILEVGHLAVLEHGTVSMYVSGISRSLMTMANFWGCFLFATCWSAGWTNSAANWIPSSNMSRTTARGAKVFHPSNARAQLPAPDHRCRAHRDIGFLFTFRRV